MELILQHRKTIFDMFSALFHEKNENILFEEEGVITKDSALDKAFTLIETEIGGVENWDTLEIIDTYFTNVKCDEAEQVAEQFYEWIQHIRTTLVAIHTEQRHNCFERYLKSKFGDCLCKAVSNMHDRLWIFRSGDKTCIISVGGSFNGLGKKICLVNKVSDEDVALLVEVLQKDLKIRG